MIQTASLDHHNDRPILKKSFMVWRNSSILGVCRRGHASLKSRQQTYEPTQFITKGWLESLSLPWSMLWQRFFHHWFKQWNLHWNCLGVSLLLLIYTWVQIYTLVKVKPLYQWTTHPSLLPIPGKLSLAVNW